MFSAHVQIRTRSCIHFEFPTLTVLANEILIEECFLFVGQTRVAFSKTSPDKKGNERGIEVTDMGTHDRGRPGIATGCIELASSLDGALDRGDREK